MQDYSQRDKLALQIINLAKAEILLENPFLAEALGCMTQNPAALDGTLTAAGTLAQFITNGQDFGFDAGAVIAQFRTSGGKSPKHDLLHCLAHCVFLHPFVGKRINANWWNISCDIAAEYVVAEILGPRDNTRGESITRTLSWIENQLGARPTAEKVYHRLAHGQWQHLISVWELLFASDEHRCWYAPPTTAQDASSEAQSEQQGEATDSVAERGQEQAQAGDKKRSNEAPCTHDEERKREPGENQRVDPDAPDTGVEQAQKRGTSLDFPQEEQAPEQAQSMQDAPAAGQSQAESGMALPEGLQKQQLPQNGQARQTPDELAPSVKAFSTQANQPGTQENDGVANVRAQGQGAGAQNERYVSQRTGAHLQAPLPFPHHEQRKEWEHIASNLSVNMQTYARQNASAYAGFAALLGQSLARPVDYRAFLRQFAALGEVMHASDQEFDYVFYTYGLQLYHDMPLVEPLEYREEARIKEFVIVIDTSGSVQGNIVRRFVDTTFEILKNTECFHRKVQVRIIQCDARVQSDDKITNVQDMKKWGRAFRLLGGGGTDFRPAFAYVDSLIEQGELRNIGGLLYFTDGWGTYPTCAPAYRSAFIFYDENYRPENVPPWAMQVLMSNEVLERAETNTPN